MGLIIQAILKGMGAGLVLSVLVGPVFFALIQTSIQKGFSFGIALATGILLSDTIYICLAYWGIAQIIEDWKISGFLGMAGAIVFIIFGLNLWIKKFKYLRMSPVKTHSVVRSFFKGFALNALNPFVIVYWISVIGGIGSAYDYERQYIIPFIVATLLTVYSIDFLKVDFATKIKKLLRIRVLLIMNRVIGSIFIFSGLFLIYYVVFEKGF